MLEQTTGTNAPQMSCGRGRRNLPTQLKTTQGRETDTSQGHGRAGPSSRTVQRAPREKLSWVGAPRRAVGAPWRARGGERSRGLVPSIASDPDRALQTSEDVRRARLTVGQLRLVEVEAASERQRHALHRLVRERAVEPRRELELQHLRLKLTSGPSPTTTSFRQRCLGLRA